MANKINIKLKPSMSKSQIKRELNKATKEIEKQFVREIEKFLK